MSNIMKKRCDGNEDGAEQRKGPWTLEEDTLLTNYIANNGEGRWNLLAKSSGLKRKGKSCRLRWLNYLKPNVKRGNLTLQEQLLILELHSKWGNRWSKIAQYLPGRTDNEIKNYWRTRVQKQARMLNIDSNSHKFLEVVRGFLVPRLIHKKMIEDNNTKPPLPPYDDFRGPVSRDKDFSQETVFNYIDSSTTSMSQELKKTPQSMDFSHHLLETIDSSMYLGGSRGSSSSSKCVSEESYNSFPCLEETTMGNSVISPFQEFHVAGSVYEEDVTQDPMWWNMDDIWQFNECEHF